MGQVETLTSTSTMEGITEATVKRGWVNLNVGNIPQQAEVALTPHMCLLKAALSTILEMELAETHILCKPVLIQQQ